MIKQGYRIELGRAWAQICNLQKLYIMTEASEYVHPANRQAILDQCLDEIQDTMLIIDDLENKLGIDSEDLSQVQDIPF